MAIVRVVVIRLDCGRFLAPAVGSCREIMFGSHTRKVPVSGFCPVGRLLGSNREAEAQSGPGPRRARCESDSLERTV